MSNPGEATIVTKEQLKGLVGPAPLRFEVFRLDPQVSLPFRAHPTDVGWDIYAFMLSETGRPIQNRVMPRGAVTSVGTGLVVKPPPGHYIQVCSRSGMAKLGIWVANAPGIVDPDYNGEIIVLLYNGSHETKYVGHGNRIAQLIISPIVSAQLCEVTQRPVSVERGEAGFGSTGQ